MEPSTVPRRSPSRCGRTDGRSVDRDRTVVPAVVVDQRPGGGRVAVDLFHPGDREGRVPGGNESIDLGAQPGRCADQHRLPGIDDGPGAPIGEPLLRGPGEPLRDGELARAEQMDHDGCRLTQGVDARRRVGDIERDQRRGQGHRRE